MATQAQAPHTIAAEVKQTLLDQIAEETARVGARYMPTLSVRQFGEREQLLRELKEMLVEGIDYGVIPGTDKPTLLLPGAQKICTFFGYVPHYDVRQVEDWTGDKTDGEPLFYYDFTCTLLKDTKAVGEGRGSCNSWESKYRFRWVQESQIPASADKSKLLTRGGRMSEPEFAINRADTTGKYGKPSEYWQQFKDAIANGTASKIKKAKKDGGEMDAWEIDCSVFRVPNEAFADIINTCQKMGQKRAYIAATLSATGASQYFTQDLDDIDREAAGIDTGGHAVGTQAAADYVRDKKLAEPKPNPPAQQAPAKAAQAAPAAAETAGSANGSNGTGGAPVVVRPVPEELTLVFANIDKDSKHVADAFKMLEKELLEKGGAKGVESYNGIVKDFRLRFPKVDGKPTEKKSDLKDCLLELWDALQVVERPAPVQSTTPPVAAAQPPAPTTTPVFERERINVPKEVEALWARMGTRRDSMIDVFAELLNVLQEVAGNEKGREEFEAIEIRFAGKKGGALEKVGFARRVVTELWKRIEAYKTQANPNITDDDLPPILGTPSTAALFEKGMPYAD